MDRYGPVICIICKKSKKIAYKYKMPVLAGPCRSNPVIPRVFVKGHNMAHLDTLFVFKIKALKNYLLIQKRCHILSFS